MPDLNANRLLLPVSELLNVNEDEILKVYIRDVRLSKDALVEAVGAELIKVIQNTSHQQVLVSFRDVSFMGSSMISKMIQLNKVCQRDGIDLRFCEMNANLMEVFDLMQLHDLLQIHETEQEVLDHFAGAS